MKARRAQSVSHARWEEHEITSPTSCCCGRQVSKERGKSSLRLTLYGTKEVLNTGLLDRSYSFTNPKQSRIKVNDYI